MADNTLYLPGSPADGLGADHAQAVLEQRDQDQRLPLPEPIRRAHGAPKKRNRRTKCSRKPKMRNPLVSLQVFRLIAACSAIVVLIAAFQFGWIGM